MVSFVCFALLFRAFPLFLCHGFDFSGCQKTVGRWLCIGLKSSTLKCRVHQFVLLGREYMWSSCYEVLEVYEGQCRDGLFNGEVSLIVVFGSSAMLTCCVCSIFLLFWSNQQSTYCLRAHWPCWTVLFTRANLKMARNMVLQSAPKQIAARLRSLAH